MAPFNLVFRSLNELQPTEGTVKLVDVNHQTNLKSADRSDVVLVPQPADDPNDPLNWPKWKKYLAIVPVMWLAAMASWVNVSIAPALIILVNEFDSNLNDMSRGTLSWVFFIIGAGNFFWGPTANYIGRRPVLLICTVGYAACIFWTASAQSAKSLWASRIVGGFFASTSEGLVTIVVSDLFFLHERGGWMGMFSFCATNGVMIGGIIAGFMISALGWRSIFWLLAGVQTANAIAMFFAFPETQYLERTRISTNAGQGGLPEQVEKSSPKPSDVEVSSPSGSATVITKRKSYLEQLKPWSRLNPYENYLLLLFRPWPIQLLPSVFYGWVVWGATFGWGACINNTYASVFTAAPYNWGPNLAALINVPGFIGVTIGMYAGGRLSDKYGTWRARRTGGNFEPEYRLVPLALLFFIIPPSLMMYAVGIADTKPWILSFVGYGLFSIAQGAIPAIILTYLVDSYYPIAPEVCQLSNGMKNIFGFGFAYAIVPWLNGEGYVKAFGEMSAISSGIILCAVPFYIWGKQIRHATGKWKIITW